MESWSMMGELLQMKAILVIDLPQTCTACPITSICATDGRKALEIVRCGGAEKRMDFCPLKPLPNRIEVCGKWISEEYQKGWNACVEVLEK